MQNRRDVENSQTNIKQKLITYLAIYEPLDKNRLSRHFLSVFGTSRRVTQLVTCLFRVSKQALGVTFIKHVRQTPRYCVQL